MAIHNFGTKNQTTNIIVITGNDETLQNLLCVLQNSENRGKLNDITRHNITESIENQTKVLYKRHKADLTCVICENKCSGYNFKVISCKSCKSFFHRNASQNLNNLKCSTNTNKCSIKFKYRHRMCRRCRLEKCLSVGMKGNSSADEEEKLSKQRQLEENRRSTRNTITTFTQTSSMNVSVDDSRQLMNEPITMLDLQRQSTTEQLQTTRLSPIQQTIPSPQNLFLTFDDCDRLNSVKLSYERAFRLTAVKRDMSTLDSIIDQRSALIHSTSDVYNTFMLLITFVRNIPEFKLLNEQDRLILFKYNSPLLFFMHKCLNYDLNRDIVIDSEGESEAYAVARKQLSMYYCGEQLCLRTIKLFRSIKKITDDDPIIYQLMMVILTFAKSVSVEDIVTNGELILLNRKQVFEAESIYTSLLFRYMIKKHSTYYQVVRRYSQLIQKVVQMQMLARTCQQFLEERLVDTTEDEVNPIIKSILRLR